MDSCIISVVIKAKNEEDQIEDCLHSLIGFADEIIVVNDQSADRTAEIAKELGARVIEAQSRNGMINEMDKIGFEAATGKWILRMDADERMTPGLAVALNDAVSAGQYTGICFARKNIMFGEWIRHGGWFRSDQLRFFRADAWDRDWDFMELHSQIPVEGPILRLPESEDLATIHLDYDSVEEFIRRTLLGYARTEALASYQRGQRFSLVRLLVKPVKRFFGRYFIRQGFRDGIRGMVLAGLLSAYDFCIEANLWDLERVQYKHHSSSDTAFCDK